MENPIREQIRLTDRWQVRPLGERDASVFIPGGWSGKRIMLSATPDQGWAPRLLEGLAPGAWNRITLPEGGRLEGASLVVLSPLHFAQITAAFDSPGLLSVRASLAGDGLTPPARLGGEAPCLRETGLLTLSLCLTSAEGHRICGMELEIVPRERTLTVDMPLLNAAPGPHRLKATLSLDENILDNARLALVIPENPGRMSANG